MLGLIFGRNCGLACVELILGRFLLVTEERVGSDLFGIGPLGEGMATVRGLIAADSLGVRSTGADRGSKDGVTTGLEVLVRTVVSMRLIVGRGCEEVAASGSVMSSIVSS